MEKISEEKTTGDDEGVNPFEGYRKVELLISPTGDALFWTLPIGMNAIEVVGVLHNGLESLKVLVKPAIINYREDNK